MYWGIVPDVIHVVVHREDVNPGDDEWQEYLDSISPIARSVKGLLVYSASAGPSSNQRSRATAHFEALGYTPQIAVLTKSRMIVGVVTALSWVFGQKIRAYNATRFNDAIAALGLTAEEQEKTRELARALAAQAETSIPEVTG